MRMLTAFLFSSLAVFWPAYAQSSARGEVLEGHGYLLAIPEQTKPASQSPLLVSLHGTKSSPDKALAVWSPAALDAGFLILCPAPTGKDWNIDEDVPRILSLVNLTLEKHKVNPNRVFLTGFSSGATLAYFLGIKEPALFASMALTSGHYEQLSESHRNLTPKIPVHIHHGGQDKVLPASNARNTADRLVELGYSVDYTEVSDLGHDYPSEESTRALIRWFLSHPRVLDPHRSHQP